MGESEDSVDGVELIAVEADVGEVDAKALLEEEDDLDGVDGLEAPADKERAAVGEGTAIFLSGEQVLDEVTNLVFFSHRGSL